jgi:hypothetical protein
VTVGAPAAGAAAAAGAAQTSTTGSGSGSAKSKTRSANAGNAAAAKVPKSKKIPKAVVKKGTPGHGPGYEKGKFTGNFFGQ